MKKYLAPALRVEEAQPSCLLADSLKVSEETVDGANALTKDAEGWDIWGEE